MADGHELRHHGMIEALLFERGSRLRGVRGGRRLVRDGRCPNIVAMAWVHGHNSQSTSEALSSAVVGCEEFVEGRKLVRGGSGSPIVAMAWVHGLNSQSTSEALSGAAVGCEDCCLSI